MAESESSGGVFDEERFLRIVELMKEHDLAEVDLRDSEQRICIKRGSSAAPMTGNMNPGLMPPAYQQAGAAAPPAAMEYRRKSRRVVGMGASGHSAWGQVAMLLLKPGTGIIRNCTKAGVTDITGAGPIHPHLVSKDMG